jgi:hypothetical protein
MRALSPRFCASLRFLFFPLFFSFLRPVDWSGDERITGHWNLISRKWRPPRTPDIRVDLRVSRICARGSGGLKNVDVQLSPGTARLMEFLRRRLGNSRAGLMQFPRAACRARSLANSLVMRGSWRRYAPFSLTRTRSGTSAISLALSRRILRNSRVPTCRLSRAAANLLEGESVSRREVTRWSFFPLFFADSLTFDRPGLSRMRPFVSRLP